MKRTPLNNKTICPFAFNQVTVEMDGRVGPCTTCDVMNEFTSIKDFLTSEKLNQLREDMFNGVRNPMCKECHEREDAGAWNFREYLVESNPDFVYDLENPTITSYQLRFSNLCNFKCVHCAISTSSTLYQEYIQRGLQKKTNTVNFPGKDEYHVLKDLKQNFTKDVKDLWFSGGEPLLHWQMWDMLNFCIENNYNPKLFYYSNGDRLEFKKQKITDLWNNFDQVHFHVGFDAMGDGCDYVRRNMKWDKVIENIKTIQKESPHVTIEIVTTFMWLNTINAVDMIKWLDKNLDNVNVTVNYVLHEHFDIRHAPRNLKNKFLVKLDELSNCSNIEFHAVESLKNYIISYDSSDKFPRAVEWLKNRDLWYKECFLDVFPELKEDCSKYYFK